MNLIEQATKRLQELGRAGFSIPTAPVTELRARAAQQPSARATNDKERCNIDLARLQAGGFIVPTRRDWRLLHEFRIIKRPLIQNAVGKPDGAVSNRNLIMVTSALPSEGKTFVAINLAMSIAMEVDCTVLLVDGDVVSPGIPDLLGIPRGKGLMDVLTDPSMDFGDVLFRTNIERLSLVQAGTPQGDASELLASDAMTRLMREVSSRYLDRIVLFDSPPLLATEARVLASRMGQVLMVVEAEKTTYRALESALATVESGPLVLTMLNKASQSDSDAYHSHYAYGR
jgi:protein-tyrosine kinase